MTARLLLILAFSGCAYAATCTSAASGNWTTPATWSGCGGTYPQPNIDNAVIAAHTVTIPEGTSVTVGTGTADAIWLNNNASSLIVRGNLTVFGHLRHSASTSAVEFTTAGNQPGNAITFTLKSSPTVTAKWYISSVGTNGLAFMTITGTAMNRVTVTTDTTAGGTAGFIEPGSFNPRLTWSYAKFVNVGTATQNSVHSLGSQQLTWSDVVFVSCGHINVIGGQAGGTQSFTRLAVINPLPAAIIMTVTNSSAMTGGTRLFDRCFFYTEEFSHSSKYLSLDARDFTFQDTVLSHAYILINNGRINNTFTRMFWAGKSTSSASRRLNLQAKSTTTVSQSAFVSYSTDANGNPHYISETAGGTGSPNIVSDVVVDGCGVGSTGDFYMQAGTNSLIRALTTTSGNLANNMNAVPTQTTLLNCTSWNANVGDTTAAQSALVIAELNPGVDKILATRNTLFANNPTGIAQGGGTYTEQTGWQLDYNAFYGMTAATDNYVHSSGQTSYLRRGVVSRVTGTVSSFSGNTSVTVSNAAGVIVGDMYGRTGGGFAVIAAVAGTALTLGQRLNAAPGTNGVTGLANGQGYTIYKNYWSSGTYGDDGKGLHDIYVNPMFVDPSRNALKWDISLGGPGTIEHVISEAGKISGFDTTGAIATFNSRYSVSSYLAYMRNGFAPRNPALKNAGAPIDGSPDIGAVPVFLTFGVAAPPVVQ